MVWPLAVATALGAGLSYIGQKKVNKANKEAAREQMAFQERMSSTAMQRQKNDLLAAGINPVLAGRLGGASSPGGAGYTQSNEFEGIPQAVATAIGLKRMKAELDNLKETNRQISSQVQLNHASAEKIYSDMELNQAEKAKAKAIQPIYDSAGNIVEAGVSTAKSAWKWLSEKWSK